MIGARSRMTGRAFDTIRDKERPGVVAGLESGPGRRDRGVAVLLGPGEQYSSVLGPGEQYSSVLGPGEQTSSKPACKKSYRVAVA